MEKIQISDFQNNIYDIIMSVNRFDKPILIVNNEETLVKIIPALASEEKKPWLGCMQATGEVVGDIVSPISDLTDWDVLTK